MLFGILATTLKPSLSSHNYTKDLHFACSNPIHAVLTSFFFFWGFAEIDSRLDTKMAILNALDALPQYSDGVLAACNNGNNSQPVNPTLDCNNEEITRTIDEASRIVEKSTFLVPQSNSFGQAFRLYDAESARKSTVEAFYRINHINQTYSFVS